MMIAIWPLVICVVGALIYALTDKPSELGRITYGVGLLWLTYSLMKHSLKLDDMAVAVWPLVIAVVGALVYALSGNAKAKEMGRIAFMDGMIWLVFGLVGKTLSLG
jgi:Na+/phosphate symporter